MLDAFEELLTADYQKAKVKLSQHIKGANKTQIRSFLETQPFEGNDNNILAELVLRGEADILEAAVKRGIFINSFQYKALNLKNKKHRYNGLSLIKTCASCMSNPKLTEEDKNNYNRTYQLLINNGRAILLSLKDATLKGYKTLFNSLRIADEKSMACNLRILGKTNADRQKADYNNPDFLSAIVENLGSNNNCKAVLEFISFVVLKSWMKEEAMLSLLVQLALKAKDNNNHQLVNSILDHYKGSSIIHKALTNALNPHDNVDKGHTDLPPDTKKVDVAETQITSWISALSAGLTTLAASEVMINKLLIPALVGATTKTQIFGCIAGTAGAASIFGLTYNYPPTGAVLSALSFVASWHLDKESVKNNPVIIGCYVAVIPVSGFATYYQDDKVEPTVKFSISRAPVKNGDIDSTAHHILCSPTAGFTPEDRLNAIGMPEYPISSDDLKKPKEEREKVGRKEEFGLKTINCLVSGGLLGYASGYALRARVAIPKESYVGNILMGV